MTKKNNSMAAVNRVCNPIALVLAIFLISFHVHAQKSTGQETQRVRVESLQLAAQLGSDLRPIVPTRLFKSSDTIFLAVSSSAPTVGVSGSLGVAWRYGRGRGEQAVHSEGKEILFEGNGITTFQIDKPDGWPLGYYSVEVFLDGTPVRRADFEVR